MTEVHDIETAPKDGTRVLLLGGSYHDLFSDTHRRLGDEEIRSPMVARWARLCDRDPDGCWLIAMTEDTIVEYHQATHWMTLPIV